MNRNHRSHSAGISVHIRRNTQPGRYVGALGLEDDGISFDEKFLNLFSQYKTLKGESTLLDEKIERTLGALSNE